MSRVSTDDVLLLRQKSACQHQHAYRLPRHAVTVDAVLSLCVCVSVCEERGAGGKNIPKLPGQTVQWQDKTQQSNVSCLRLFHPGSYLHLFLPSAWIPSVGDKTVRKTPSNKELSEETRPLNLKVKKVLNEDAPTTEGAFSTIARRRFQAQWWLLFEIFFQKKSGLYICIFSLQRRKTCAPGSLLSPFLFSMAMDRLGAEVRQGLGLGL